MRLKKLEEQFGTKRTDLNKRTRQYLLKFTMNEYSKTPHYQSTGCMTNPSALITSDDHAVNSSWPHRFGLDTGLHRGLKSRHSESGDLGAARQNTETIWIIKYMGLVLDGSVSGWCTSRLTKTKSNHPSVVSLLSSWKTSRLCRVCCN